MKKGLLTLAILTPTVLTLVSESALAFEYDRWYGGYESQSIVGGYNYYGIHSAITAPSRMPFIENDTNMSSSMTTNYAGIVTKDSAGSLYTIQAGITMGYDRFYKYHTTPAVYIEWGPVNNLRESIVATQGFGQRWDYWIRREPTLGKWKVNVNHLYTTDFYLADSTIAKLETLGEVNISTNKNGPTRFDANTYLGSDFTTWRNFDGGFKTRIDSGFTVTGSGYDFTVTR